MSKPKEKKHFKPVARSIKNFLKDEDGFVTKSSILKISLGTVASMGILSSAFADYNISPIRVSDVWVNTNFANFHTNSVGLAALPAPYAAQFPECQRMLHTNTTAHLSHSSHDFHMNVRGRLDAKGWVGKIVYNGPLL
ncbi:MAG: hypothetical protein ABH865_03220 [Candidatus Omnitrophota bacterium]